MPTVFHARPNSLHGESRPADTSGEISHPHVHGSLLQGTCRRIESRRWRQFMSIVNQHIDGMMLRNLIQGYRQRFKVVHVHVKAMHTTRSVFLSPHLFLFGEKYGPGRVHCFYVDMYDLEALTIT